MIVDCHDCGTRNRIPAHPSGDGIHRCGHCKVQLDIPSQGTLDKVKCFLGFHDWGKWKYVSPSSCQQVITCQRCKRRKQNVFQVSHNWGDWKDVPGLCQQVSVCQRCKQEETREAHLWEFKDGKKRCCVCDPIIPPSRGIRACACGRQAKLGTDLCYDCSRSIE